MKNLTRLQALDKAAQLEEAKAMIAAGLQKILEALQDTDLEEPAMEGYLTDVACAVAEFDIEKEDYHTLADDIKALREHGLPEAPDDLFT